MKQKVISQNHLVYLLNVYSQNNKRVLTQLIYVDKKTEDFQITLRNVFQKSRREFNNQDFGRVEIVLGESKTRVMWRNNISDLHRILTRISPSI